MITKNDEQAREMYQRAVLKHWGEEKDIAQAVSLYQASATLGFAGAQNNLGDCYEKGLFVPQSQVAAIYWYTRAAERGEPTAFLGLASLLNCPDADQCMLVEALKNAVLARTYLEDGGNKDMAIVLESLIVAKLPPLALQLSYDLATAWKPLYQEEYLISDSPEFKPLSSIE